MRSQIKLLALFLSAAFLLACGGPGYVRGSENPELDKYAMSTGLDKKDLESLFTQNSKSLMSSGAMKRWRRMSQNGKEATVAIFPIANKTSEHIDSQLQALLSDFETTLVNSGEVSVISHENQDKMLIQEIKRQQSRVFDRDKAAQFAKQLGVKYFVTGKVHDSAEKAGSERRVQYFLFMQAIEVETGVVRWQNKATLTKAFAN